MVAYRLGSTQSRRADQRGSECWRPLLKAVVVAFLVETTYLNTVWECSPCFRESPAAGRRVRWLFTLHPSEVRRQREGNSDAQLAFFSSSPLEPHSIDGTTHTQGKPTFRLQLNPSEINGDFQSDNKDD